MRVLTRDDATSDFISDLSLRDCGVGVVILADLDLNLRRVDRLFRHFGRVFDGDCHDLRLGSVHVQLVVAKLLQNMEEGRASSSCACDAEDDGDLVNRLFGEDLLAHVAPGDPHELRKALRLNRWVRVLRRIRFWWGDVIRPVLTHKVTKPLAKRVPVARRRRIGKDVPLLALNQKLRAFQGVYPLDCRRDLFFGHGFLR